MDEPQPTQNLFRPHEQHEPYEQAQPHDPYADRTQVLGPPDPTAYVDQGGYADPAGYPGPVRGAQPVPEWPRPIWRRRGALVGAGLLVLVVAGLVVGIVLAAPSSPPTPANAAATLPAASTAPAAGKGRKGPKLAPGEKIVAGTVSSVTNNQITVTLAKGGNPVTVTTDDTTKFVGSATSVTDLRAGQRVQMIVRNGTAVTIRAREPATGG